MNADWDLKYYATCGRSYHNDQYGSAGLESIYQWHKNLPCLLVYNIITFTYISILSTKISYSALKSSKPSHRNQT